MKWIYRWKFIINKKREKWSIFITKTNHVHLFWNPHVRRILTESDGARVPSKTSVMAWSLWVLLSSGLLSRISGVWYIFKPWVSFLIFTSVFWSRVAFRRGYSQPQTHVLHQPTFFFASLLSAVTVDLPRSCLVRTGIA